ncbi:MAG: hypothetical protein Udaeo2_05640 [Candidatus Udaeobacter sp.]|nr:MAG: hypothetical protein Udaeo2_05640 [Candidatus Udaeobacter sp.]
MCRYGRVPAADQMSYATRIGLEEWNTGELTSRLPMGFRCDGCDYLSANCSPANYSDLPVPFLDQRVPSAPTSSALTSPVSQRLGFFSRGY